MPRPSDQIQSVSSPLFDVFRTTFYEIPVNQREYKWTRTEIEQFWNDLCKCINDDIVQAPSEPIGHFLGAIVVIGSSGATSESRLEIIDGQQRLTTVSILAGCILDKLCALNLTTPEIMRTERMLWTFLLDDPTFEAKLRLNREDEFFRKSLLEYVNREEREQLWSQKSQEINTRPVCKSIYDAFHFFYQNLDRYLSEREKAGVDRATALAQITETLAAHFYVLWVRVLNTRMAYRFFETLNERGLDLTQADLIRNTLLEYAKYQGERAQEKAIDGWREVIEQIDDQPTSKLSVPQLIQFSFSSRYGMTKADQTFEIISRGLQQGKYQADQLAYEFSTDALGWSEFLQGNLQFWSQVTIDVQYAITDPLWKRHAAPLLFAVNEAWNRKCALTELNRALAAIEVYLFRQGLIVGDGLDTLQDVFSEAALRVRKGCTVDDLREYLKGKSPTGAFVDCFKVTRVSNMKQAFYVAWKIEDYIQRTRGQGGLDFRPAKQSPAQHLEHILPRKPGEEWEEIQQKEEFSEYLNRIGNHMVLEGDINRRVKNASIGKKIEGSTGKGYRDSSLHLPKEVVERIEEWGVNGWWTFDSIKRRQEYLAEKYAAAVWSFDN